MPEMQHDAQDGIEIDLISGERMRDKTSMEKIRMILDDVREGNIVILEEGLTPDEESKLIEVTMTEINPEDFTGIEIESFPRSAAKNTGLLSRIVGNTNTSKLTVIGPANQIHSLHKDETLIRALVSGR
ncbi:MAG: DUF2073 domain-containing protein [Halodesulfurarchaeum sp.]